MTATEVRLKDDGQALLEFLSVFPALLALAVGGAALLKTEWNRDKCAYQVFEGAHHALRDEPAIEASVKVRFTDSGVHAEGQCGLAHEAVDLPYLESAQW